MGKLEGLLRELCPDGVEHKFLKECCILSRGDYITKESAKSGDIPVILGGQEPAYYINKANHYGKAIVISRSGVSAGFVSYWDEPIFVTDGFIIETKQELGVRFLYYYLKNMQSSLNSMKKGGGVPHITGENLLTIKVPVPPLPIQKEIVQILDNFAKLSEELTAELTARRKQYEYYKELLLSFDDCSQSIVEYRKLGDVAQYAKKRIEAAQVNESTYIGVENLLPNKQGKIKSSYVPQTGVVIAFEKGDILIGNIRPYLRKIWLADRDGGTNGDVLAIQINNREKITAEFLYYVLSSEQFFLYDIENSKGAKMPRGDKKAVLEYLVPIPPLEEQARIVSILDRFDALCNNLTSGLPAEIAARRRQYEYYRDKLLCFPEKRA